MKLTCLAAKLAAISFFGMTGTASASPPLRVAYIQTGQVWEWSRSKGDTHNRLVLDLRKVAKFQGAGDHGLKLIAVGDTRLVYLAGKGRLYVIRATPAPSLVGVVAASDAALSPNGRLLACEVNGSSGLSTVRVLDAGTLCRVLTLRDAAGISWSSNSSALAIVREHGRSFDGHLEIVRVPGGKIRFRSAGEGNEIDPVLFPSGRFTAVEYHLSRPVSGDEVEAVGRRARDPAICTPHGYLPAQIEDISSSEKLLLWNWRTPDPDNDGNWLRAFIGASTYDGKRHFLIGKGGSARFVTSTDVAWLAVARDGRTDLVITDLRTRVSNTVAKSVTSFAVPVGPR